MATPNDIYEELREIAPLLHELKRTTRQPEVPAGYFEHFANSVIARLDEPGTGVLSGHDRSHKPTAPELYFDTLADQVMDKIRTQEQQIGQGKLFPEKPGVAILYFRRLAVAATILGVIVLATLLFERQTTPVNDCEDGIACLTREEIRQYVSDHTDEFEAEAIHEAFQPEIDAEALEVPVAEDEVATAPVLNEEQIEKYIEENPAMIDFEDASTDIF